MLKAVRENIRKDLRINNSMPVRIWFPKNEYSQKRLLHFPAFRVFFRKTVTKKYSLIV
jgi:hypothetical protein